MTDTQWADVAEFQTPVNNSYPYQMLCIRSNDGDYEDKNFAANRAWCDQAVASGKLAMYIVNYFFRPTMTGFSTLKARVGTPNPKMAVMIDVESDGGNVSGNQSANINSEFNQAAAWLGDARRVIGYGNVGDLDNLWPQKPAGIRLVVAAYGSNPGYAGKFAQQYTDAGACAPFGTCDMNSADGMALGDVVSMFGFSGTPAPLPPHAAPAFPWPSDNYIGTPRSDPKCHSGHYGPPDSDQDAKAAEEQLGEIGAGSGHGASLTPAGATIPGVTHHRADVNGTRLHYVSAGTSGSPILLIHGWPESWWAFRKVIPMLAASHRVFVVDLRGFGDSSTADGSYDIAASAEDSFSAAFTERTFRQVAVGQVTSLRIEGVGHLVAQEAPEALSAAILEFVAQVDNS